MTPEATITFEGRTDPPDPEHLRAPLVAGISREWLVYIGSIVPIALAAMVLRFTVYGRHLYAVGGNPEAARLAGLIVSGRG